MECKKCINTSDNSFMRFNDVGYCSVCEAYEKYFDAGMLKKELIFLKSFAKKRKGKYNVIVGLSGGKDSSATLYLAKKIGFSPLAFSLDTGYFPGYIFRRAKVVAKACKADYKILPAKHYVTKKTIQKFRQMTRLYERNDKKEFMQDYVKGRAGYQGIVRPCWVCRDILIRAYYNEALKHNVQIVILGINEWTCLKQSTTKKRVSFSAIRKLKPFKDKPAVFIVHLPFLLQVKLKDTRRILKKIGWNYYKTVQSNAYSCLLACAAEKQLYKNLGFHPDTTRLAREVTVGFLSKKEARNALKRVKTCQETIKEVLNKAKLV